MTTAEKFNAAHRRVCPWWMAYTFDNPLRRFFHKVPKMLGPYIKEGMTVMDVGCGMGFFSIRLAKMIGDSGKVIAVDLQQRMLDVTLKRARRTGVADRILAHRCKPDRIGISAKVDFILAFWMVHEIDNHLDFFTEIKSILTSKAKIFIAEPAMHVSFEDFQKTLQTAQSSGLRIAEQPAVRFSLAALLEAAA